MGFVGLMRAHKQERHIFQRFFNSERPRASQGNFPGEQAGALGGSRGGGKHSPLKACLEVLEVWRVGNYGVHLHASRHKASADFHTILEQIFNAAWPLPPIKGIIKTTIKSI